MRPAGRAWLTLAAGVVAYEIAAPRGELLSEGSRRCKQRHPIATTSVVGYFAAHLLGWIPPEIDPLTRLAVAFGR